MFFKIQYSSLKLNSNKFEDLVIENNKIINKKINCIIKEIKEIDFNSNIYDLEIEVDKLGKTLIIYLKINISLCEQMIESGIVIPNRENFFKFLSVYHLSENVLNNKIYKNIDTLIDENLDKQLKIFPHNIIKVENYIYDLKFHRIQNSYDYINCNINGGVIYNSDNLSILQILKNLNKELCLFILNSSEIDIYKNIADSFKDGRKVIVLSNINTIDEKELEKYNNVFVTINVLRKYYLSVLKEYLSKSKNIDFFESLENLINDNKISLDNSSPKPFFNINWQNVIINSEILISKKSTDIIKSITSNRKWVILDNKSKLDSLTKSILKLIVPVFKVPDNLYDLKPNTLYYKSINEIPFLKTNLNTSSDDLISLKNYLYRERLFKIDKQKIKESINYQYNKNNIEYIIDGFSKELFKICEKYNQLEIFYYFLNPSSEADINKKIQHEIKILEDNIKHLLQKEKMEEFKLKLAIHEKIDKSIIHSIKQTLSDIYEEMEEKENKISILNKNIQKVDGIDDLICPISCGKIYEKKYCINYL